MSKPPYEVVDKVFVYGTLMPGGRNAGMYVQKPHTATPALLPDYCLAAAPHASFPYCIPASWAANPPAGPAVGYLLTFRKEELPRVLSDFDHLEGVPYHYERRVVKVFTPEPFFAYTYVMAAGMFDSAHQQLTFVPYNDWKLNEGNPLIRQGKEGTRVAFGRSEGALREDLS